MVGITSNHHLAERDLITLIRDGEWGIRDEATKDEVCDALQKEWNRACALEAEIERLTAALARAAEEITLLRREDVETWNAAIEAAAVTAEGHYIPGHTVVGWSFGQQGAEAIRALRKETP